PQTYDAGIGSNFVAAGDINGDGTPDIVVMSVSGTVSALLGNGDGTFQNPILSNIVTANDPTGLALGDFNGDGKLHVLTPVALAQLNAYGFGIMLSNGDGTFQPAMLSGQSTSQSQFATGDLNGDGRLDVVFSPAYPINSVSVLLGKGDGTFQSAISTP